ncbi:MAG: hypothetical protein ABGY75_02625 [Gemmataceae bacterium]
MTWKMLSCGDAAVFLNASNESGAKPSDLLRIRPEGTHVDDRVVGIVVHVQHRRERHMDADRARLHRRDPTHLVGQPGISGSAERHQGGEVRGTAQLDRAWHLDRSTHSKTGAGLEVGSDQ